MQFCVSNSLCSAYLKTTYLLDPTLSVIYLLSERVGCQAISEQRLQIAGAGFMADSPAVARQRRPRSTRTYKLFELHKR